jgi:hypothetical protein
MTAHWLLPDEKPRGIDRACKNPVEEELRRLTPED